MTLYFLVLSGLAYFSRIRDFYFAFIFIFPFAVHSISLIKNIFPLPYSTKLSVLYVMKNSHSPLIKFRTRKLEGHKI